MFSALSHRLIVTRMSVKCAAVKTCTQKGFFFTFLVAFDQELDSVSTVGGFEKGDRDQSANLAWICDTDNPSRHIKKKSDFHKFRTVCRVQLCTQLTNLCLLVSTFTNLCVFADSVHHLLSHCQSKGSNLFWAKAWLISVSTDGKCFFFLLISLFNLH